MIAKAVRLAALLGALLAVSAPRAPGATPKEVDRAIQAGAAALKAKYKGAAGAADGYGSGPMCLAGIALLEAGVKPDDPTVKGITDQVRAAAYTQSRTYQVALCLMYLNRLDEPADVPLIQVLAARLLVGQMGTGGWTYDCCAAVVEADVAWLKANLKPAQLVAGPGAKPKMHPDAERYLQALVAAKGQPGGGVAAAAAGDDNSNTQFALLAVWMARKHGVPVDAALDLVEKRFLATQDPNTWNWPYSGTMAVGSPSMYCAGLLGLATGLARREERRLKADAPAAKPDAPPKDRPTDPFAAPPGKDAPPPKKDVRPPDVRDLAVRRAFAGLGASFDAYLRAGKLLGGEGGGHGHGDLYFLWSLERVGVVYDQTKLGGHDWYDHGATALVRSQGQDGMWAAGGYGADINTAFAVLFLCKSNLARDLSNKVQKDPTSTEMRAGTGPAAGELPPTRPPVPVAPPLPAVNLPNPTGDPGITQAAALLKASGSDWAKLLAEARDAKGPTHTRALALTARHADGDRKSAAREALAERLCRMTPATLRGMLKADDAELRRAAALACAMKEDRDHIPDLIAALTDADDAVTRAAKAGLKSLTGKDFGPVAVPTAEQKTAAAAAWNDWLAKEKK